MEHKMENTQVTMLGTGSPRPDLERSGPAQVVDIGGIQILVDCGEGTTSQLMKAEIRPEEIEYLFFTHLHSDHTFGYGQFLLGGWGLGRRSLTIVGPEGTKDFHEAFLKIYEKDIQYRTSLGRPGNGVLDVTIIELDVEGSIHVPGLDMNIETAKMVHNVKTFAYRFEWQDNVVVISGDTAPTPNIEQLAKDADLLVIDGCLAPTAVYHQTTNPELKEIWRNLQKEHCTPKQAAEIAVGANVGKLVLTHFLPGLLKDIAMQEATAVYSGPVIIAEDLLRINVNERIGNVRL